MENGSPSLTAYMMAALRARHYISTPEPRILDDSLALRFCGMTQPDEAHLFAERMIEQLIEAGGRSAAETVVNDLTLVGCIRARYFEDRLAEMAGSGLDQVVILGAGLDSTAYRCSALAGRSAIFEVDHPATQVWKRRMLASNHVYLTQNLTFVPFDFERQSLRDALAVGGIRSDRITLFSWLGVQPYLTHEAVLSALDTVASFRGGSSLVMDLTLPTALSQDDVMAQAGREKLAAIGEPFLSAYSPSDFHSLLAEREFSQIEMIHFQDWLDRSRSRLGGSFKMGRWSSMLVAARVS